MQPLTENAMNVPAFLSKLWKMVNDPGTDHLICWSPAGNSFYIQNQAQFWYELLPLHYKHNNMSSFVRQLNMYGFHKMSTYENGTMDCDKDEIQFFHPFFQKDQPELLKNIKRKVTSSKHSLENINTSVKGDDLLKVLDDVKQLRGRQASVDSQLSAMKHENAVLWRELAMLRQKHLKQQQIVNKLIQFLVTCVHPRPGGLGVKRRYPLMLNENPAKKSKRVNNIEGPTIHELDSADLLSEELLQDETDSLGQPENSASLNSESEKVQSPLTPHSSTSTKTSQQGDDNPPTPSTTLLDEANADNINSELFWDTPEFVYVKPEELLSQTEDNVDLQDKTADMAVTELNADAEKVFLNPTTQDTLLSNLINGSYNTTALSGAKGPPSLAKKAEQKKTKSKQNVASPQQESGDNNEMTVATRDPAMSLNRLNSVEDLDLHLESTQSELEQLKDILNGYNSFDANALLGLFNDETPEYGLSYTQNETAENDPLVSGSELTTYDPGTSLIDFNELFDDSTDVQDVASPATATPLTEQSINTPQVEKVTEPVFPSNTVSEKKRIK